MKGKYAYYELSFKVNDNIKINYTKNIFSLIIIIIIMNIITILL